jgi:hypothetical protein
LLRDHTPDHITTFEALEMLFHLDIQDCSVNNMLSEPAPDYDRAASLYRQALAQPDLEDRGDGPDRLDDLADEKRHPEKRDAIKQARLQHIQRRKGLI